MNNGNPVFDVQRSKSYYDPVFDFQRTERYNETLIINPEDEEPRQRLTATLVGPGRPDSAKSFYNVWGSCSGVPFAVWPMGGYYTIIGSAPPKGQEDLYRSLQASFKRIVEESGIRPDCSYQR